MEDVCSKIEKWIRSKVREAGARGAVVGMSGGVDSSVVSVLAKRSLGRNVLGLILPIDSCPGDAYRARQVAKKFGIKTEKINLSKTLASLENMLPKAGKKTLGNLKSRLRMAVLYYYANKYRYMVLGTSNKSELKIGYFTKYGDGGVDLEPLGGLYKTEVLEIARYLGLPRSVIETRPSAGLWKGQSDRKEIGMDYEKLDRILKTFERRETPGLDPRLVARVKRMIDKSKHKRRTPEVCELP